MKQFKTIVACGVLGTFMAFAAWLPQARAAAGASDNSCNYGSTWTNGNNFGTGFGAWAMSPLPTSGNVSYFVGSAGGNGSGCASGGGINGSCGNSWGIFANNNNTGAARRSFSSANGTNALLVGQTFAISWDNGFINQPGTVGFSLENASSNFVFQCYFRGGSNSYSIADSLGNNGRSIGVGYTEGGMNCSFSLTSPTNYTFTLTTVTNGFSTNYVGVISNAVGGVAIVQVRAFNFQGNSGNTCNQNAYYNNLSITCPTLLFSTQPTNLLVCAGSSASFTAIASNTASAPVYQWQKAGVNLTSGGTVSGATSSTLTISPVSSGDATNYTCIITDSCSISLTSSVAKLAVTSITVSPTTLPNVSIGVPYNQTVTGSGGTGPYNFSVTAGALPAGLALTNSTGQIYGTYSGSPGSASFTITATDQGGLGCSSNRAYTVNMVNCPTVTVSNNPPAGTVQVAYSTTVSGVGGASPYTFTVNVGSLPNGLSIAPSTGVISGTPTLAGAFNFTVLANDSNGCSGTTNLSIVINCPVINVSPGTLPAGTSGAAYSQTVSAAGGNNSFTYSVSSGSLPIGLSLNSATGVISGTPTVASTYNFTVKATDSSTCFGSQAYSVTISCPAITLAPVTLPFGVVSISYSTNITASGGSAPLTFGVTGGTLPGGLTLSSAGLLSGKPTAAGTNTFTVTATDTNSCTGNQLYTVIVGLPPAITAQPAILTNCSGTSASFTVASSSTLR